jgi:thiol-disulfide isomerase/thioredoxin
MKRALPYILTIIGLLIIGGIYLEVTNKDDSMSILDNTMFANKPKTAELKNLGPAPEFVGIEKWLNSEPLTQASLKGKVVLIDFWTYSCINCIRTLPYVTKWYDTYKDDGLVVVGVHTPEFAFEKVTANVETAIKRHKINYPVAQDNNYDTWSAYNNRYWPAEYLIDQQGNIVYTHFGEGNYDVTENTIRQLLGLETDAKLKDAEQAGKVQSPEMYFGTDRLKNLVSNQVSFIGQEYLYQFPTEPLPLNTFAMEGSWQFFKDKAVLYPGSQGKGKIRLHFKSGKVFMVATAGTPLKLDITVDGKAQPSVTVKDSQLYTLFDSNDYSDHVIEISIPEPGNFEAFTFTFG